MLQKETSQPRLYESQTFFSRRLFFPRHALCVKQDVPNKAWHLGRIIATWRILLVNLVANAVQFH